MSNLLHGHLQLLRIASIVLSSQEGKAVKNQTN